MIWSCIREQKGRKSHFFSLNVFIKVLAVTFFLWGFSLSKQPVPCRPPLPAPAAICCSCLKSSEATGEGWARYVQQTVEQGRSMSRIVSLYKSVSDNSPWPSACCWLLSPSLSLTHTQFTHSWGRHTFHTLPGDSSWLVTMGSHSPVENTDCIWHSHYRWLFTHWAFNGSSCFKWELNGRPHWHHD